MFQKYSNPIKNAINTNYKQYIHMIKYYTMPIKNTYGCLILRMDRASRFTPTCLSYFFLNVSIVLQFTTSGGKLFHLLTTLLEKNSLQHHNLALPLTNRYWCPLVKAVDWRCTKSSWSILSIPLKILNTSIISPRHLRSSNVNIFKK